MLLQKKRFRDNGLYQFMCDQLRLSKFRQAALKKIDYWLDIRQDIVRPSWDEYFLNLAFEVSKRSHDLQTQHGSVIVNNTNEIISTGYNGTLRDINDEILPNVRPEKYDWMIHSEHVNILTCARQGKSTLGTKIYVTGEPCLYCYQYIWQVGITEVIYGNQTSNMTQDIDMQTKVEIFKALTKHSLTIRHIDFPKKPQD